MRDDGKAELTYKTRRSTEAAAAAWSCPLPGASGKREVDVGLRETGVTRTLSLSCELESRKKDLAFPADLRPVATGCESSMKRFRAGDLKVEQWLAGQRRFLEVSMPGKVGDPDLARFQALVAPLVKAGIRPLDRSKTEIGSACGTNP